MRQYYLIELEKAKFGKSLLTSILGQPNLPEETIIYLKKQIASLDDSIEFFGHKLEQTNE